LALALDGDTSDLESSPPFETDASDEKFKLQRSELLREEEAHHLTVAGIPLSDYLR
jgi:hypothetical protein